MKKILVLGGTQFVGRNLIEQLIQKNDYELTLFNRGKTNAGLFAEINHITGDRLIDEDLKNYTNQTWDIIIDISGYWPTSLEKSLEQLKGKVGRYIYISTSSHYVFDEESAIPLNEEDEIVACTEEQKNDMGFQTYNERKAECERVLQQQEWLDYVILRPGLIIGNYDPTDRLYYWFYKLQTQQEILWPNEGKNLLSYSNVGDLVKIIIAAIEQPNKHKVYNASSIIASLSDFINVAKVMLNKSPNLINASLAFLEENEVQQWSDLPVWLNGDFLTVDNSRVIEDFNLTFADINKITEDLIAFYSYDLKWRVPKYGMSAEKESEILSILRLTANS